MRVHELVAECPPLDTNSVYCNLLQCTHFADTSAVAEIDGDLVGFVAAYNPPGRRTTLFVWQVAVAERARRQKLGLRMLKDILRRMNLGDLTKIQTTISEDNEASWALFSSLTEMLGAPHTIEALFDSERHFAGTHATEHQLTIGPITQTNLTSLRLTGSKANVR